MAKPSHAGTWHDTVLVCSFNSASMHICTMYMANMRIRAAPISIKNNMSEDEAWLA